MNRQTTWTCKLYTFTLPYVLVVGLQTMRSQKFIYWTTSFSSLVWEKMNCQISGIHSRLMEEKIEEMDQEQENQDQAVTDNQEILITSSGTHVDYTEIHIILVKFAAVCRLGMTVKDIFFPALPIDEIND